MDRKQKLYWAVITMVFVFFTSGCAFLDNYGKIRLQSGPGERMTIEKLKERWQDYTVHYTGLDIDKPGAIMFDPKNDDKDLIRHRWWDPVKSQKELSEIALWTYAYSTYYDPTIRRVLGPNDQFYGYLYTDHHHVLIRVIDDKTLWVDEMVVPPHIHDAE